MFLSCHRIYECWFTAPFTFADTDTQTYRDMPAHTDSRTRFFLRRKPHTETDEKIQVHTAYTHRCAHRCVQRDYRRTHPQEVANAGARGLYPGNSRVPHHSLLSCLLLRTRVHNSSFSSPSHWRSGPDVLIRTRTRKYSVPSEKMPIERMGVHATGFMEDAKRQSEKKRVMRCTSNVFRCVLVVFTFHPL